jgi:hypothetical protein
VATKRIITMSTMIVTMALTILITNMKGLIANPSSIKVMTVFIEEEVMKGMEEAVDPVVSGI